MNNLLPCNSDAAADALMQMCQQTIPNSSAEKYDESKVPFVFKEQACLKTQHPSSVAIVPKDCDVLCGRGNDVKEHPGNIQFRALVLKHKVAYVACSKEEKAEYAKKIVGELRTNYGTRFLRRDVDQWFEIDDKQALDKTRQALREGAPIIERHLKHKGSRGDKFDEEEQQPLQQQQQKHQKGTSEVSSRDVSSERIPQDVSNSNSTLQRQKRKTFKRHLLPPGISQQMSDFKESCVATHEEMENEGEEEQEREHKLTEGRREEKQPKKRKLLNHFSEDSSARRVTSRSPALPSRLASEQSEAEWFAMSEKVLPMEQVPPAKIPNSAVQEIKIPTQGQFSAAPSSSPRQSGAQGLSLEEFSLLQALQEEQRQLNFLQGRHLQQQQQLYADPATYYKLAGRHLLDLASVTAQQQQQWVMDTPPGNNNSVLANMLVSSTAAGSPGSMYMASPHPTATVLLVPTTTVTAPTMVAAPTIVHYGGNVVVLPSSSSSSMAGGNAFLSRFTRQQPHHFC